MSQQLTFNLGLDATPMINAAGQATQQLEQKFKQAGNNIRQDLEKPIVIQAEFNLDGDPKKKYNEIVSSQKKIKEEQKRINKGVNARKKLQDKVNQALKGTRAEKKAALKLVERLMRTTGKTQEEMKLLAAAAKDLKKSLPKDADMPSGRGTQNLEGNLTKAGVAANLATKAIESLGRALVNVFQTGVKMQSLNLQMEAFAGGANQAALAMSQFQQIAAKTPLDVMQVAEAGKIMMAFGVDTDLAVEATERLAITAAATGGDVNLLARNLGQVQAQGRAYTRDLTQFAIQGIPIWEQLSQVTGKSVVQLKELAREGQIGMQAVMQALRNMTKDGSAFAQVAERMQETFAGKFALIQSEFQTMAGNIVEGIAAIDQALGTDSIVKALVEGLKNVGLIFKGIGDGMAEANYQTTVMEGNLGRLNEQKASFLERIVVDPFESASIGLQKNSQLLTEAAQKYRENNAELFGAKRIADEYGISLNGLASKLQQIASTPGNEQLVANFRSQAEQLGQVDAKLNKQIATYMELSGVTSEVVQQRISELQQEREAAQANLQQIESYYQGLADAATTTYNEVKTAAEASIENSNAIIANLQEQIKATQELGPAGQKLQAIKRQELEYTAKTGRELKGHITSEEMKKLRAQATLERLDGQAKAEKLRERVIKEQKRIENEKMRLKEAEQKLQEDLKRIDAERTVAIQNQNTEIGNLNTSINNLVGVLNGNLAPNWSAITGLVAQTATETGNVTSATGTLNSEINETLGKYDSILAKLDEMRIKILTMPSPPAPSAGPPNAFAGGPVRGGDMRTVNELGKEAFLSASGKLSMINAPAWGEWRAPSSGTIIPAHLTKQLDIPTGGININKTAGAGAGVGAAVKVIQASGGDVFHQNVTVQSSNPTQAANNMMVEMTRLRRRRFG